VDPAISKLRWCALSFSFVATWNACRCPGFVELADAIGPPWTSYLLAVGFDFCDGGEKVLDPSVRLRWGLGDCKTCHLGLSREVIRKRTELNPVRFSQSIMERIGIGEPCQSRQRGRVSQWSETWFTNADAQLFAARADESVERFQVRRHPALLVVRDSRLAGPSTRCKFGLRQAGTGPDLANLIWDVCQGTHKPKYICVDMHLSNGLLSQALQLLAEVAQMVADAIGGDVRLEVFADGPHQLMLFATEAFSTLVHEFCTSVVAA